MKKKREYDKKYYLNNRDRLKKWAKGYYSDNREVIKEKYKISDKEKLREERLMREYGLCKNDYNNIFEKQDGLCAICGDKINSIFMEHNKNNCVHVDHDHKTKKIRGLLCHNCNIFLGNARDNIKILSSAIKYLEQWQN